MVYIKVIVRLAAISALLSLMGCAFGTREVTLRNSEIQKSSNLTDLKMHTICFDGLIDKRRDSTIGHVQNGYGMRTAEVKAVNDVSEWINKEIQNRLVSAGYKVKSNCQSDTSSIVVEGEILKVYTTAYMTYLGEVTINASIQMNQNKLLEKEYAGHQKTGTNWAATGESFRDVLESSLEIAMTQFIKDIDSLDHCNLEIELPRVHQEYDNQHTQQEMQSSRPLQLLSDSIEFQYPEKNGAVRVVSGTRSTSSIRNVIDSIKFEMTSLYRERYELNDSLAGSICIYFQIDSDGNTSKITFIQNSLNDKPMEEKLISLLSSAKFWKIENDANITGVTYKLIFTEKMAKSSKNAMIAVLAILAVIPLIISMITLTNKPSFSNY